uniref:Ubiquitin carboxyl-terminal hydrolase n=1 Tax=Oncorhynchus tshawytscha TaxID=74940 RepID=A0A8C8M4T9_ONCTS
MYIFGEFSPDEINQFFVTPRCYVELTDISFSAGEDYQHIEFGVDEVMDLEPVGVKDPLFKVSSTLNPQAPEFILGCQPSQKVPQTAAADVPDGAHYNSLDGPDGPDGPDSEPSAMDSNQNCQDGDGGPGSLGQRERKKKKKRPPGYYNYLEGSGPNSGGMGVDGPPGKGLVNGHALSGPHLGSQDMVGKMLSGGGLSTSAPVATAAASAAVNQRTCDSPDESSLDFTSGAASLSDGKDAASSSSSSSQSSGVAEGGRTAEQQPENMAPESPELLGSGGHSPCPLPLPLSCCGQPPATIATATTEEEEETKDSGVANGLAEPHADISADGHKEASEALEQPQQQAPAPSVEPASSPDSEAQPSVAEQPKSPASPAAPAANPLKSWASLFHNSKPLPGSPQAYVEVKNVVEVVAPSLAAVEQHEKAGEVKESPVHVSEDPMAPKLAELIENVKLIHKPVSLQPRGLINRGNWCYINATLQALIACPPMYHLLKSIPLFNDTQRPCTSTPMMDNFVRLVNEFNNMPVPSKAKQQAAGEKMIKDIRPGAPFEPNYIYRLLTLIKSSLSEKGRQEDAEEYLGFTLNGLHEEMLALKKLFSPQEEKAPTPNGPESQSGVDDDVADKEEGSEDEWEQVGPRNKTSITRQADFVRTPITDIFGGHIRSVVYQQNSKESATLQPFFTLQLDIQSEKIRTVQEALETLVARESVQGYTTKTKQEIEISRRVTLEELPPVLVLHLKRFVFEKTGGCQKLIKNIDYPVDLEISKDLLSSGVRSKIFKGQRTYRLFAVVYHHGNSATGGHYTTDVFHIGLNGWLRIDDQSVKVINQYQVVKQTAERTAYLLYYRRVDLL